MVKLSVGLNLAPLTVTLSEIELGQPSRRRKEGSGPFLILSRANGMALSESGIADRPCVDLRPNHGERHQFWFLRPSATKGAALIVSADHALALDEGIHGEDCPVLWTPHGEPWQRWNLQATNDGVGFLLQAVHSGRYLSTNFDAEPGWKPWYDADPDWEPRRKEWMIALAYGSGL